MTYDLPRLGIINLGVAYYLCLKFVCVKGCLTFISIASVHSEIVSREFH